MKAKAMLENGKKNYPRERSLYKQNISSKNIFWRPKALTSKRG